MIVLVIRVRGGSRSVSGPYRDLWRGSRGARPRRASCPWRAGGNHGSARPAPNMSGFVLPRDLLFLLECGFLLCPDRVIYMSIDLDRHGAANWRKSRRSVANGACVEVAAAPESIIVRDSVNKTSATLRYSPRTWRAFLAQAKTGKFDVKKELTEDHGYSVARIRLSSGKSLDMNATG